MAYDLDSFEFFSVMLKAKGINAVIPLLQNLVEGGTESVYKLTSGVSVCVSNLVIEILNLR